MSTTKSRKVMFTALVASAGLAYWVWKRSQKAIQHPTDMSKTQARHLLERVAPLLRLPTSPEQPPEVLLDDAPEGAGLRCPVTGRIYPYRDGILYLLEAAPDKTFTQQVLDTPFTAWVYDRFRETITRAFNSPDFAVEVAEAQRALQVQSGNVLLDLACGQGNFTVEWAKRAGSDGLVIGLDYSLAMLARAVYHVNRWGLDNVLLIHGDAHALPFADGVLHKVNCSGGFHQFPNLPQALREIARVSAPGAILATSTFAEGTDDPRADFKRWLKRTFDLHFVPLAPLEEQLAALGYADYTWSLPGSGVFGYASARKARVS
jgi:ubiquinone/menaquinone biosynthesis C-methylase UbiE